MKLILTNYRMVYTKKYKLSTYRMKQKGRMERVIREVQKNEGCEIVKKKKTGRPSKGQDQKGRRPVKDKNHVEEKSNI